MVGALRCAACRSIDDGRLHERPTVAELTWANGANGANGLTGAYGPTRGTDSYRGLGRVLSGTPSACAGRQEFFGTADPFADLAWVEYLDEGTGGETERPRVSAPSHTAAATCPCRMGYMHTCPYMPPPA